MKFSKSAGRVEETGFPIQMKVVVPTFQENFIHNIDDNGNKVHDQNRKKRVKWLDECMQSSKDVNCQTIQEVKNEEYYTSNFLIFDIDRGALPEGSDVFKKTLKDLREEQQDNAKLSACIIVEKPTTFCKGRGNINKPITMKIVRGQGAKGHSSKTLQMGYKLHSKRMGQA